MRELRDIFDTVINMVNIVLTDQQKENGFVTTSSTFFSWIKPILEAPLGAIPDDVNTGYQDTTNALGFGVGEFEVVDRYDGTTATFLRVVPLNINAFKLPFSYHAAFQYLTDWYCKQIEKDNYGMLTSAGINIEEHIEIDGINEVREWLMREFSVEPGVTI